MGVQVWDSLQGLCSYIRGMLSSQAILKGILTEQSGAQTAAGSAVYTYFMRDISGMIGGIAFAALQVTYYQFWFALQTERSAALTAKADITAPLL